MKKEQVTKLKSEVKAARVRRYFSESARRLIVQLSPTNFFMPIPH